MPLDDVTSHDFRRQVMSAELLDADTEIALARAWKDNRDEQALHRLINAYMRLAVSMASKFRRYGGNTQDLIQEAGVGLMKAADKFDPDRGVRFSTYAQWWIKAAIQDYVMRNWSMVRTGSTSSQKSLFFNLKRVQATLEREAIAQGVTLDSQQLTEMIATDLGVPLRDVEMMQGRMSGSDFSLNAQQSAEDEGREWQDTLADDAPQASEIVERNHDLGQLRNWLNEAMSGLNERERYVLSQRLLIDDPRTLGSIGEELGLSKERIRQVEAAALGKLKKLLEKNTGKSAEMMADLI
jgi:RNA polymerase sigma-32 factor